MKIEKVKIAELNPAEYNPRRMTNKQYEDLKNSLEKFGLVDPIIINSDNTVVGGHQRLRIMREMGAELVPVVRVNLSKEDEKELNIRLNKNTGEFDLDVLANNFEVDELKDWGFKDVELGFNIDKIVEGNIEDDHIPEVKESRVKLGDVWELGKHRLMCGDSTKESDVNKLMNGQKADMVFTDPPYGMNLDTNYSNTMKKIRKQRDYKKIMGDNEDFTPELITTIFKNFDYCKEIFIWGFDYFAEYIPKKNTGSIFVWSKADNLEHCTMGTEFELCWSKKKHKRKIFKITQKGFFGHNRKDDGEKKIHPTQKSIKLHTEIFKEWCLNLNTVVDLYLGSGSTLIACEKTNRTCYGMELDTKYCDVIIERWEQFTGQKAKKI